MTKIQPNKKTIRKALHNRFLIYMMREAISDGRGVTAEAYLMDALIGLYNVLYYDPALKTPCSVKEFIEKIRQENLIVDDSRTIIGKDGDMGEVQLKSGIWRIQMDSLPAYSGIGSNTKEDMLIAYILGLGNSVHCCITIGEHFLEFLHEVDDWIPLIKQYLERYFLAAEKMERIEAISRKTFEPLVKGIMEDTGFRYKAEYHNVSCVELIVWLSNGSKVKFSLGMDDFTKGCCQIKEDLQTLDTLARRYGTRMSIGHDRSK